MLWPRIVVPESGYNLAASGAVGKNAYDEEEVAYELIAKLKVDYPALMEARYPWACRPRPGRRRTTTNCSKPSAASAARWPAAAGSTCRRRPNW
jgi:hypothetical protein